MSTLMQDVRFGLRTLRRNWVVSAVAVASLALALGGNAAVFSLVDAILFRPLPYPQPERIVLFGEREKEVPRSQNPFTASLPTYVDLEERSRTLATWGAVQFRSLSVRGTERAEAVSGAAATPGFFEVLQVRPVLGRAFGPEEGGEGGRKVVLLGHDYWIDRFGPESDPLGEVLTVNGEPHEVVGVLPPDFDFLTPDLNLWVPLAESPRRASRDDRSVLPVARMKPSATMDDVGRDLSRLARELEIEYPETQRGWTIDAFNLRYDIPNDQTRMLFGLLQGSVFLVLLIACVNITNLLLARSRTRAKEIALRSVLGAGRGRIVRQLLTESSVMVVVGAGVGLVLGALGIEAISRSFAGVLPATYDPALDHRVVLFTLGISALAGLVFGVAPALQTFGEDYVDALKEGGGHGGSGRKRKTWSRVLVIGEIALSFVALGGGSLLVRSFLELQDVDPGFETSGLLTASVQVPSSRYPEEEDRVRLGERIVERAEGVSGVRSAALANAIPQGVQAPSDSFRVVGEGEGADEPPRAFVLRVSPHYAETLDVDVLRGRFFDDGDRLDRAPVVVVSRSLAEKRFRGRSPLGRSVHVQGRSRQIVGVVEDIRQTLFRTGSRTTGEAIYLPRAQAPDGASSLILKAGGDPKRVAAPLREALQELDRDLVLARVLTMDEFVEQFFTGVRVFNVILTGFGIVGLLLAALGTYGVLAYSVSQRRHEIGIRMAVGAPAGQVVKMVARQGFWMGTLGLVVGAALTLPLVSVTRSLLQDLAPVDPVVLVYIGGMLFGVTMFAGLLPAVRAATVDPVRTLRDE